MSENQSLEITSCRETRDCQQNLLELLLRPQFVLLQNSSISQVLDISNELQNILSSETFL